MDKNIIKITSSEKSTTLRLTEKTKKMLEYLAIGKETHEEIILRLIKMATQVSNDKGTQIIEKDNISGTKYERIYKQFEIVHKDQKYSVVCTFNDLTLINMLKQNKQIRNYIARRGEIPQWEVNLEVVNIKNGNSDWQTPDKFDNSHPQEFDLIYLVCLKRVLEETFDISLYELSTEEDLFNIIKWDDAYKRNDLSRESFYADIEKKVDKMSSKQPDIYIFSKYANPINLKRVPNPIAEVYGITFDNEILIKLSETNSLVEDMHSMNIHSAKYLAEGRTESKEAMIHHHTQGHADKHLQFKLVSENKKIRIILEFLDKEEYIRCIKGFIYTTKKIIEYEKAENKIKENLVDYFFNDKIEELAGDRLFLLRRVKAAFESDKFLDDKNIPVCNKELEELKKESHLLPFLEWEQ